VLTWLVEHKFLAVPGCWITLRYRATVGTTVKSTLKIRYICPCNSSLLHPLFGNMTTRDLYFWEVTIVGFA
jgi:hypothetical protein